MSDTELTMQKLYCDALRLRSLAEALELLLDNSGLGRHPAFEAVAAIASTILEKAEALTAGLMLAADGDLLPRSGILQLYRRAVEVSDALQVSPASDTAAHDRLSAEHDQLWDAIMDMPALSAADLAAKVDLVFRSSLKDSEYVGERSVFQDVGTILAERAGVTPFVTPTTVLATTETLSL